MMRIVQALHFDAGGHFVAHSCIQKVDLIDAHRLREIAGWFAFGYSALALTEGIGLDAREGLGGVSDTRILTISFLPWELFELARGLDVIKIRFCCSRTWPCWGIWSGCCGANAAEFSAPSGPLT